MADFSSLPAHILHDILGSDHLEAEDLGRLETICYTFRAACGLVPYRFHSIPEAAARHRCQRHELFSQLPPSSRSQLLARCSGSWKLVLRFLDSLAQTLPCKVATGKYHTLVVQELDKVFWCGTLASVLNSGISGTRSGLMSLPSGLGVAHVSAAFDHIAILSHTGEIYTLGKNASGCCGHGDGQDVVNRPTLVAALAGVACKQVETGQDFTVALTRAGEVFTWGRGQAGNLGHGDEHDRPIPEKVDGLPAATRVSAGVMYTLVVTQDGSLFSFGSGGNFNLAHGSLLPETRPRLVQTFHDKNIFIVAAAAGDDQSAAIDSSGFVYTWGLGYCGALGHGDERDRPFPEKVMALQHHRAVQVVTRKRKTIVLDDSGQVFAFGWESFGGLGVVGAQPAASGKVLTPERLSSLRSHHITQISTGYYHTAVATRKGSVLVFGDNEKNQLGTDIIQGTPFPIELYFMEQQEESSPQASSET